MEGRAVRARNIEAEHAADTIIPDPGPTPTVAPEAFGVGLLAGTTVLAEDDVIFARDFRQMYFVEEDGVEFTNNGVIWLEDDPFDPAVSNVIDYRIAFGNLDGRADFSLTNNNLIYVWAQGFADIVNADRTEPVSVTNTGTMISVSEGTEATAVQSSGPLFVDNSGVMAAQTLGMFGVIQNEGNARAIRGGSGFQYNQVINRSGGQILAEAPNLAIAIQLTGASQSGQVGSSPDTALVDNAGLIEAHLSANGSQEIGVVITGGSSSVDSIVRNSGTIRATNAITGTARIRVENETGGAIAGALTLGESDDTVINDGVITGLVDLGADDDTLVNSSQINGNLELGSGEDTATNAGTIEGDVDFGSGTDSFTNTGTINGDIFATSGDNTLIDNGTIRGAVAFGDGNDLLVSNSETSFYFGNLQMGSGDDTLRIEGLTGTSLPNADGGAGHDTIEFASTSDYFGDNFVGFEVLSFAQRGNFTGFNGYLEINIIDEFNGGTAAANIDFAPNILDSDNSSAAVTLASSAISLVRSSVASVTGSDGREFLDSWEGSFFGNVNLGGGDDLVWIRQARTVGEAFTSLDGGDGDLDELVFFLDQDFTDNLSRVTGFERIQISDRGNPITVELSDVSGLTEIFFGGPNELILSAGATGDMSGTAVTGVQGGTISIAADLTIGSYLYTRLDGARLQGDTPDPARSTSFLNQGTVLGDIVFNSGNDLYDGSNGSIGGTVFGHAGNDTFLGGEAEDAFHGGLGDDHLEGGAGRDVIEGGDGDDTILGGAGDDTAAYVSSASGVTVDLSLTDAQDTVGAGIDTIRQVENLIGSSHSDILTGNSAGNRLTGGLGDDYLDGGGGRDLIEGGDGDDTIIGGNGMDTANYLGSSSGVTVDLSLTDAQNTVGAGMDTIREIENVIGSFHADILTGNAVRNQFIGSLGDDTIDGGGNIDTAIVSGNRSAYSVTQIDTGVFRVVGADGTDTLTNVEYLRFDDETMRLRPGTGLSVNFGPGDPSLYQAAMNNIRDFAGNDLPGDGSWQWIGEVDVNGDGDVDQILVNDVIGRFATVGTAPDGLVYFDDHGWAGETRVAGIYIDPLVTNGTVEAGGPNDSQRRFRADLRNENIDQVLGADDFNGDGIQEVYFSLANGTAYLRALMHADGNIRYANYQNEQQLIDYLTRNGYDESTYGDWLYGSDAQAQQSEAGMGDAAKSSDPVADPLRGDKAAAGEPANDTGDAGNAAGAGSATGSGSGSGSGSGAGLTAMGGLAPEIVLAGGMALPIGNQLLEQNQMIEFYG